MPEPQISVIIMAYNRTEFLKDSIASVKNQSLGRKKYEIIVTSNFSLDHSDTMLENVKYIYAEGHPGYCLSEALCHAKGEVIALLDDDDTWQPSKLEVVYDAFSSDKSLGYFHNNLQTVDRNLVNVNSPIHQDNLKRMKGIVEASFRSKGLSYTRIRQMISLSMDFNNSSICFRKSILIGKEDILRESNASLDCVLFYLALSGDYTLLGDGRGLTSYRIHSENVSAGLSSSAEDYLAGRERFTRRAISQYTKLLQDSRIVTSIAIGRSLQCTINDNRLELCLFQPLTSRGAALSSIVQYLRYSSVPEMKYNLTLVLLGLTYILSPKFVKQLYVSRFRNAPSES